MSKRLLFTLIVSAIFSVAFLQASYFRFEKVRDIVAFEIDGPEIQFDVPAHPSAKFVMLEFRNDAPEPVPVEVRSSTGANAKLELKPQTDSLFYLSLQGTVQIRSASNEWSLKRAELRNIYGSMRGVFSYVIAEKNYQDYDSPGIISALILFLALVLLTVVSPSHKLLKIAIGILSLFFLVLICVPFFSGYRLLLAAKTFFLLLLLVYFLSIRVLYRSCLKLAAERWPEQGRALVQSIVVSIAVFVFFLLQMLFSLQEFKGNYSAFLQLSKKYVLNSPLLRDRVELHPQLYIQPGFGGYDAQFFYIMAFDPFLDTFSEKPRFYRRVVDNPPYRYGRIGFSLLTKVFSLNTPELYPKVMVMIILCSHGLGAFFLSRIAIFFQRSAYWGLLYLLVPAFTAALRLGLPESVATSFVLGGVLCEIASPETN